MSKKQIIQLLLLLLFLCVSIFFMVVGEWGYLDIYALMSLVFLSGFYVIYAKKNFKFVKYLRFFTYTILSLLIFLFFNNNFSSYGLYSFYIYEGYNRLVSLKMVLNSYSLYYILMILSVLLFNKPLKSAILKIGKISIHI